MRLTLAFVIFGLVLVPAHKTTRVPTQVDVPFGTHGQLLDLYAKAGAPVIVFIHQGGWTGGDKGWFGPPVATMLAAYEVVVPNYRLAPQFHYPDPVIDVQEALAWTEARDSRPVAVIGFSSGGNLALLAAMGDPIVTGIVTWSAPVDLVYMLAHHAAVQAIEDYLGPTDPAVASPIDHVTAGIAPTLLFGSYTDFVPYQTEQAMSQALNSAGDESQVIIEPKGHAQAYKTQAWPPTLAWLTAHLI